MRCFSEAKQVSFEKINSAASRSGAAIRMLGLFVALSAIFTQMSPAVEKTFNTSSGSWNSSSNWTPSGVPAAGDDVIIPSGRICSINTNTNTLASLTINGTLTTDGTARTITVSGNITIASTGIFQPSTSNVTHTVNLAGNLENQGTLNSANGSGEFRFTFNGSSNQSVWGSGTQTEFWQMTVNNSGANGNNIVEIQTTVFTNTSSTFLTLTDGTLKMSGSFTFTSVFFSGTNYTINTNSGLWLNNPNVTVTGLGGDVTLQGQVRISSGTYNVGTSSSHDILFDGTAAKFIMEGGACNVQGRFDEESNGTDDVDFSMSSGVLTVGMAGVSSSSNAVFDIESATSTFTMSGGTIVIREDNSNSGGDFRNVASTIDITGGTLQFGNGSSASSNTYEIRTASACPAVDLYSTSASLTLAAAITVWGDMNIRTGTTFSQAGNTVTVKKNWILDGTYTHGNGRLVFNGNAAQTMSATTSYELELNNTAGGLQLLGDVSATNALVLTSGVLQLGNYNLTMGSSATIGGTPSSTAMVVTDGTGEARKIFTSTGSFTFPVGDITGTTEYSPCTVNLVSGTPDVGAYVAVRVLNQKHPNLSGMAADYINRYWNVSTNGITSATVSGSFTYTDGDINGNEADYTLGLWAGSVWSNAGMNTAASNTLTVAGAISLLGDLTAANDQNLPVELTMFHATRVNRAVKLVWKTATEANNMGFEVQRSNDGRFFETLGFIDGHGTVNAPQSYSFTDSRPNLNATQYYRLKQIDRDGASQLSEVVEVASQAGKSVALENWPNPVSGSSAIRFTLAEAGPVTLIITNALGQEIARLVDGAHLGAGTHVASFDARDLRSGNYFCAIQTAQGSEVLTISVAR